MNGAAGDPAAGGRRPANRRFVVSKRRAFRVADPDRAGQSPNSVQMNPWATGGAVELSPPDRARGSLRTDGREIAEDLAIRLRRKHQG